MPGGWLRRQTGCMQAGIGPGGPAPGCSVPIDLTEKADTAMHEADEDRLDAAEQLAEYHPRAAAEALSAIASDQAVGDEVRLSAAQLLADVDPHNAAPACVAIASDQAVGDEVRLSAAEQLAALDLTG
jgi:hypothetical protein